MRFEEIKKQRSSRLLVDASTPSFLLVPTVRGAIIRSSRFAAGSKPAILPLLWIEAQLEGSAFEIESEWDALLAGSSFDRARLLERFERRRTFVSLSPSELAPIESRCALACVPWTLPKPDLKQAVAAKSEPPTGIAETGNLESSPPGAAASVDYSALVAPAVCAALFPRETETPIVTPKPKPTPTPKPAPRHRRRASGRRAIGNVLKALPGVAAVWALLFLMQPTERTQARLSVADAREPPWSSIDASLSLQPLRRTRLVQDLTGLRQSPPENPLISHLAKPLGVSEREHVQAALPPTIRGALRPEAMRAEVAVVDPALKMAEAHILDVPSVAAAFPPPLSSVAKPTSRRLSAKKKQIARVTIAAARPSVATLEIPDVLKPQ